MRTPNEYLIETASVAHEYLRVPGIACEERRPIPGIIIDYYPAEQNRTPGLYSHIFLPSDAPAPPREKYGPVGDLLQPLVANAYLYVMGLEPPPPAPRDPRSPYLPTPSSRTVLLRGPEGEGVELTFEERGRTVALWQLEILGWAWDESNAEAKASPTGSPGRPKLLRRLAVATLAAAMADLDEEGQIDQIRLALRWFFPPDRLSRELVRKAIYDDL